MHHTTFGEHSYCFLVALKFISHFNNKTIDYITHSKLYTVKSVRLNGKFLLIFNVIFLKLIPVSYYFLNIDELNNNNQKKKTFKICLVNDCNNAIKSNQFNKMQ